MRRRPSRSPAAARIISFCSASAGRPLPNNIEFRPKRRHDVPISRAQKSAPKWRIKASRRSAGYEENLPPDPSELLCGESKLVLEIGAVDRHVAAADDQIARLGGQEIDEQFPIMMEERTAPAEMRVGNLDDAQCGWRRHDNGPPFEATTSFVT
jgi:hypothetical protein